MISRSVNLNDGGSIIVIVISISISNIIIINHESKLL